MFLLCIWTNVSNKEFLLYIINGKRLLLVTMANIARLALDICRSIAFINEVL